MLPETKRFFGIVAVVSLIVVGIGVGVMTVNEHLPSQPTFENSVQLIEIEAGDFLYVSSASGPEEYWLVGAVEGARIVAKKSPWHNATFIPRSLRYYEDRGKKTLVIRKADRYTDEGYFDQTARLFVSTPLPKNLY